GRKAMIIFGLLVSAFSSLAMGLVNDLNLFYVLGAVVGLFSNAGGPAQQAMVADLLPEEKRADGYGLIRVIGNLAVTIGPMFGGFLANRSFLLLFILDAITSTITAVIVFFALPETKPEVSKETDEEDFVQTLSGYGKVLRDGLFMAFLGTSMLAILVYSQMNSTLSVFLRDMHGVSPAGFGWIMSMNAGMVVVLQFAITRWLKKYPPMLVMVAGTLLYAIGFSMYGFISAVWLFFVAMIIITLGEMFVVPIGQALVACFAPDEMRGRYMAMYGFSWAIPSAVAPLLAGLIMDNGDPNWVWYASGIVALLSVVGYYFLHSIGKDRFCEMELPG
ncbi:MAG: MDR family MFS transporter, partial [Anaerolineales bacterium]